MIEQVAIPSDSGRISKYALIVEALRQAGLSKAIRVPLADYPMLAKSASLYANIGNKFPGEKLHMRFAADKTHRIIWREKRNGQ